MAPKKKSLPTPPPVTATETPPDLTVNDIQSIERIINIATTRGAFRANEMTAVGQIYDRISKFLAYVAKVNEEKNKQEETKETTNV